MSSAVLRWDLGYRFSLTLIQDILDQKAVPLQASKKNKIACTINICQVPWSKSLVWRYFGERNNQKHRKRTESGTKCNIALTKAASACLPEYSYLIVQRKEV